jgi:hypothetical protein
MVGYTQGCGGLREALLSFVHALAGPGIRSACGGRHGPLGATAGGVLADRRSSD